MTIVDDHHVGSFIDGSFQSAGADRFEVVDPTSEAVIERVAAASIEQAHAAVTAAVRDQPTWAAQSVGARVALVSAMADELEAHADDLTSLIVQEVGMPREQARGQQVGSAIAAFRDCVHLLPAALEPEVLDASTVVHEPVGVVVAITPWNYPLYQAALKVAPALAAGCAVVLKPSEVTPLTAIRLAEAFEAARAALAADGIDVPAGIFSVVIGDAQIGDALVGDPRVDLVSLTGSTAAGRAVAARAAAAITRVSLELGGKSPLVVLGDADLDAAVAFGVQRCFMNSGQTCAALTRLIVPRARLRAAEQAAARAAEAMVVGDPGRSGTHLGPLVSRVHRDRVVAAIREGIEEGARLVTGGPEAPHDRGWFVTPTVFSDTDPGMRIVREEVFGPVLVLQAYDTEDEAIELANGTEYGLAAGVFGTDEAKSVALARRIRAGAVFIGGAPADPRAPFGGVRGSGYGRERGAHGLQEFLVTKTLHGVIAPAPTTSEGVR